MSFVVKLSVIMPVYNEARTLPTMVDRVLSTPLDCFHELIIIDDGSTDGSREIIRKLASEHDRISFDCNPANQGKGAALRRGFAMASGNILLVQDADLEYTPADYPSLLEPMLDGRADVVFGSRFLGGPHRVIYYWHYVANRFLTAFSNMLTNINLTDMETCYKAFRSEVIRDMVFRSRRFGFEPEFTAKVAKRKFRIYEVPISYSGRTYAEGKKIGWTDAVKAFAAILWFHFFE
jgi:glycosyltransferase involved in cell wall biosynthesis